MDSDFQRIEDEFNAKAEDWIAKQGIWFQLTHSVGGRSFFRRFLGVSLRLSILLIVLLVAFWFYLVSRPETGAYQDKMVESLKSGFGTKEVGVDDVSRDKKGIFSSELKVGEVRLYESQSTFFEDWYREEEVVEEGEAPRRENVRKGCMVRGVVLKPLGLFDGVFTGWKANEIYVDNLNVRLKVGGESDQEAMAAFGGLFRDEALPNMKLKKININTATIAWGNVDVSKGEIKDAKVEMARKDDHWDMNISGGTFSQGWIKGAAIESMHMVCHESGTVEIKSAYLKIAGGEIKLNAKIQISARPEVNGEFELINVDAVDLLGKKYEDWLDGKLKGKGTISGALNTTQGIETVFTMDFAPEQKADAEPEPKFVIKKFKILNRLQSIYKLYSFQKLALDHGTITVTWSGGNTKIALNDVKSENMVLLKGELSYALQEKTSTDLKDSSLDKEKEDKGSLSELYIEDEADMVRGFSGSLQMGLLKKVFKDVPSILEKYPEDEDTLRVWIPLKLKGDLEEITQEISDELLEIQKASE